MSLNEESLKALVRESLEQRRSQQAISHAGKTMRGDGVSFEQWIDEIISGAMHSGLPVEHEDDLPGNVNYYDLWLSGERSDDVLADLKGAGY
ncbi:MAG: hypothetical protein VYC23_02865 [Chloroflexota bacterium]|nr:hypothetical protein [Chloroflexota bacterium]